MSASLCDITNVTVGLSSSVDFTRLFHLKGRKKKNNCGFLHCGLRPTKAESASFRGLTCLDGQLPEQWRSDESISWCSGMWPLWTFFSESTASDNPSSFLFFSLEDAFTDSLQVKVSFFFIHKGPKAVWQCTPECKKGSGWSSQTGGGATEREREKSREVDDQQQSKKKIKKERKPLLPAVNNAFPAQNGLIPLCPAVLPHCGWPLPCCEEEETASYLHQITFLYTPPHWPYHGAYPESGARRSRSRRPRPSRVSAEQNRAVRTAAPSGGHNHKQAEVERETAPDGWGQEGQRFNWVGWTHTDSVGWLLHLQVHPHI